MTALNLIFQAVGTLQAIKKFVFTKKNFSQTKIIKKVFFYHFAFTLMICVLGLQRSRAVRIMNNRHSTSNQNYGHHAAKIVNKE